MRLPSIAIAALALAGSASAYEIDPAWSIARVWDEEQLHAVRLSTPRPPVHARNFYHVNAAMYDAWATFEPTAQGLFVTEKNTAKNLVNARREAISYAAYRVLKARYIAGNGPNIAAIQADFDALFLALGYDKNITTTVGTTPAAIGNRVAAAVLAAGLTDGSNEQNNYFPTNGYAASNTPMPFKIPGTVMANPDNWQQLAFDFLVLQNGEIVGASIQTVVTPHWNSVTPFGMNNYDRNPVNDLYFDQGPPPLIGTAGMVDQALAMLAHSAQLDATQSFVEDISPSTWHNSPLGSYEQPGYGLNPVTGEAYEPNPVLFADYARVNAEYWADGADSETPPGHWHVIANLVSDNKLCTHQLFGEGDPLDRLEWDVKLYLAVGGAVHDASITAWGMKGFYDSARPISFVRYMGQQGQCSDPKGPNFSPNGLPLTPGLVRMIEADDVLPGGEFEDMTHLIYEPNSGEPIGVDNHVGDIVVMSWLGGFSAGTTTGIQATGPIPGHVHRTDSGWNAGGWDLGVNDSPGALNPGLTQPASIILSESRNAQQGADSDEYIELSGPSGASLDGLTLVVIGDEVQTAVPDPKGRVQVAIDLTGYSIGANGTFLIGRGTLSLATPDLVHLLNLKEIGNTTYALMTGFTGYPGKDLDLLDDGTLNSTPWTAVVDSFGLRRNTNAAGIYFGSPTVGPMNSKTQTYGVGWQLATHWMTYQASNFVTPPFPGYTSGHSTYSRAAANALSILTGSEYFPGGLQTLTIPAGWLKFENGPTADVVFNWVKYFDLADEAGESRIWGGIHPPIDDIPGRMSGDLVGKRVMGRIKALYSGNLHPSDINGDGIVDGADLGILLGEWNNNSGVGDLNGDGLVDGADLGILLGDWGS